MLVKKLSGESGQATLEFAMTLPFIILFSMCIVQLGGVANNQLALNHAARTAARAISLADITPDSAQQLAINTVEREINLKDIAVAANLSGDAAKVELNYSRRVEVPLIGVLLHEVNLHATATMPRQLTSAD